MADTLKQIRDLRVSLLTNIIKDTGDLPIFYAGDIFDKWNNPPQLVNFAIDHLPRGYAIAGNHDLPYHSPESLKNSSYGTLMRAKVIHNLDKPYPLGAFRRSRNSMNHHHYVIVPFPYGSDIDTMPEWTNSEKSNIPIALVHRYVWDKGTGFPGAAEEDNATARFAKMLKMGFRAAFFGDNHKPFSQGTFVNCGGLFRRTSLEYDHTPHVYILDSGLGIIPFPIEQVNYKPILEVENTTEEDRELREESVQKLFQFLGEVDLEQVDFVSLLKLAHRKTKKMIGKNCAKILSEVIEQL